MRLPRWSLVAAVYVVAVAVIWYVLAKLPPVSLVSMDFINYWSAGRVYLSGGNPYDPTQMAVVQQPFGPLQHDMITFWYLPWFLPLMALLGHLYYSTAFFLAFLLFLALALFGCLALWVTYGGSTRRSWPCLAAAIAFAPLLMVLLIGQAAPLVLFGLALFLYLNRRGHEMLAGAALSLISLKPQLVFLVCVVVLLWVISARRWRLALGGLLPLVAGCAIVAIQNRSALLAFLQSVHYGTYPGPPTLLSVLGLSRPYNLALAACAAAWAMWYWHARRANWQWDRELPLLVLVSLVTTPIIWAIDLALILLPVTAILAAFSLRPGGLARAMGGYLVLDAGIWCAWMLVPGHHERFVWVPLVSLVFYLVARRHLQSEAGLPPEQARPQGPDSQIAVP